jgi:hypothetical protein
MQRVGKRKEDQCEAPPRFFVSVDSKEVDNAVSLLESTLARAHISVDFKRVKGVPSGLQGVTSGEGREEAGTSCRRGWGADEQGCEEREDAGGRWIVCDIIILYHFDTIYQG